MKLLAIACIVAQAAVAGADPIADARNEFELVDSAYVSATVEVYQRDVFMPDAPATAAADAGDFIGRLRTLYGPRDGDVYVLRHKATGYLIAAYAGKQHATFDVPTYAAGPRFVHGVLPFDPKKPVRPPSLTSASALAGDRVLRAGDPALRTNDRRAHLAYQRHLDDVLAPDGFPPVAARLEQLVASVSPSDWSGLRLVFDPETQNVLRIGCEHGRTFADSAPPTAGFAFFVEEAGRARTDVAWAALYYYVDHASELTALRKHVLPLWRRILAAVRKEPRTQRTEDLAALRALGEQAGLDARTLAAAR